MTSTTDVVNSALRILASARISSLTDGSPPANAANDIYDDLIDDLLRRHPWNFAMKRAKLGQLSKTPEFEFDHAYGVPADWLRTISCYADSGAGSLIIYHEELVDNQRAIVTDADDIYMRYVARIKDTNLWSADFRRAVVTALARDLAVPVASSNTLQERYAKEHRRDIARAQSSDAMGSSSEQRPRGSWVARRGGAW